MDTDEHRIGLQVVMADLILFVILPIVIFAAALTILLEPRKPPRLRF
jgi:hypothetical protein